MKLKELKNRLNKLYIKLKSVSSILISIILAIIISVGCYLINNSPYPLWDSLDYLCWTESLIPNIFNKSIDRSDALFLNVAYDKDVAEYTYSNGNLVGTTDITNRNTLLEFLKRAERADNYKYILLDIQFDAGVNTPIDSSLFAQIHQMRDIIYPCYSDIESIKSVASDKAGVNNAFSTTITSFTRYQFLQNGKESIPLKIFKDTDKLQRTIVRHGLFYTFDGKLCYNSPFLCISENFLDGHDEMGNQNYYDLGPMFLNDIFFDEETFKDNTNGKIIVIGDFLNDTHDTYKGKQPGSFLIYLAYKELSYGNHIVPVWFVIFMTCVYFLISLSILTKKNIFILLRISKHIKSKAGMILIDLIGYSFVLTLISILTYLLFGIASNVTLPALVFTILTFIVNIKSIAK